MLDWSCLWFALLVKCEHLSSRNLFVIILQIPGDELVDFFQIDLVADQHIFESGFLEQQSDLTVYLAP